LAINAELIPSLTWRLITQPLLSNMRQQPPKSGKIRFFYCNQRGISTEDAVGLIVNGYAHEVINKLPMEFAVEAQKLSPDKP